MKNLSLVRKWGLQANEHSGTLRKLFGRHMCQSSPLLIVFSPIFLPDR
jgi:hypothetical protein